MAAKISAPVGPWEDPVVKAKKGNKKPDVKAIQKLLASASAKLKNPKIHPGTPDGAIAKISSRSSTIKAILAFQQPFMKSPDGRVDPGGTTLKKLNVSSGPVAVKKLTINGKLLHAFVDAMTDGHCKYSFGTKASPLTIETAKVKKIDCSGFVQYLLYTVTTNHLKIHAGSWHQNEYFETNNFAQVDYATEASNKDNVLRLGYYKGSPGHIWFVLNGMTIESSGGKGPNRRLWSTLKTKVQRCYVIANVTSAVPAPTRKPTGRTAYA